MKNFFVFLALFLSITMPVLATDALYQSTVESKISSGVTLKNYIRFTSSGWQNINVLEIDMDDKYTNLGLLTSSNGVGTLQNLKTMATNADAIAAINADFFQANSGRGSSIGFAAQDGEIISSANLNKNKFATFILDENDSIFYEYFSNEIILTSQSSGDSTSVAEINKYPDTFENLVIFTPAWGKYSHGSVEGLPLTEMVVENNKVTAIKYNESALEIPENGFVVSGIGVGADFINTNFKIGTKVKLDFKTSIDIDEINLAVSGGSILLNKGKIPETFSDNITGTHPRSAIGSSKDESKIYLVTVDGRQKTSIGMTEQNLAEFLKEIGVYNAINLDGGGSTTMIARKLGENNLSTINSPSGGSLRSIINGIGVFNNAPSSSKITNLIIEVSDTNVFKGKEREISVKAYNKYFNPVEINENDIKWSYEGVPVEVNNGILKGNTVGMTMLKATLGKASAEIEINILSDPNELSITPKKSTLSSGKNVSFKVEAKNKNGYYSCLADDEINWKVESYLLNNVAKDFIPEDAKLENGIFSATTSGDYIISVTDGNIKSYALITISGKTSTIIDNFENEESYVFDPYPDEVSGDATKSDEQSHSGNYSTKLSYDFKRDIQIRAAYIEFKNNGIDIPANTTDIGFWLYNDSPKDEQIKIKLRDANGRYHLIVVQKGITHTGWQEFTYSLSNISLPGKITDIYLAQDDINIQSEGYVYIDDLTFYAETTVNTTTTKLPKDIKGIDELNKTVELEDENSYVIAVIDKIEKPSLMIEYMRNILTKDAINSNAEVTIFTSQKDETIVNDIDTEKIFFTGYDTKDYKNSTFITVDSSNSGIRNTNSKQWITLQKDIKKSDAENVFIITNNSLDNFSDNDEARLFIDMLCDLKREINKNIWVLHKGNYTDYSMERGIKYIGINNDVSDASEIGSNTNCIFITVNGKNLTYEIKNIFE